MSNPAGWAVQIVGDSVDLNDLKDWLPPPFDPWVETRTEDGQQAYLLRSAKWAGLAEAGDVARDAERIVQMLHGQALLIHPDARGVALGRIFKFDTNGKSLPVALLANLRAKSDIGRLRVKISVGTGAGPSGPTKIQQRLADAAVDDVRADLFVQLGRSDNWFDVYKTQELARRLLGGKASLHRKLGSDKTEWERVWRTANCARHAPDPIAYPLPNPPAEIDEARSFLFRALNTLLG